MKSNPKRLLSLSHASIQETKTPPQPPDAQAATTRCVTQRPCGPGAAWALRAAWASGCASQGPCEPLLRPRKMGYWAWLGFWDLGFGLKMGIWAWELLGRSFSHSETSNFFKFFWFINRVLKTRFSGGCHMEKDATSDVIRPWKSSLWVSIYRTKSSLKDSRC